MIESRSLLISNAQTINLVNSFVPPTLWVFDIPGRINKIIFQINTKFSKYVSQTEANQLLQGSPMDLGGKYCFFSTTVATAIFFAPILPSGVLICLIGSFYQYILEKLCLTVLNVYRRPEMFTHKISQYYIDYYIYIIMCFPLGQVMLTNFKPYPSLIFVFILLITSVNKVFYKNLIGYTEEEINLTSFDIAKISFNNITHKEVNPIKDIDFKKLKEKLQNNTTNNLLNLKTKKKEGLGKGFLDSIIQNEEFDYIKSKNRKIINPFQMPKMLTELARKKELYKKNNLSKLVLNAIHELDITEEKNLKNN